MSNRFTPPCLEPGCMETPIGYRSCGHLRGGCRKEISYRVAHGGDERAVREMIVHHQEHEMKE